MRMHQCQIAVALAMVLLVVAFAAMAEPVRTDDAGDLVRFGAEMAQKGNWREAMFRWEQASKISPDSGRIANNLAVAQEVLGDREAARVLYRKALDLAPGDPVIQENVARASRSWKRAGGEPIPTPPAAGGERKKKNRDTVEVAVELAVPPRVDVSGMKSLLVASFLVEENDLLDSNREIVRFIRSEFRKRSALQVLDVTPPPAVPEQTLEDMAANAAFWSHMGREYGADVIVSGMMRYTRLDASGFQDVDIVSEETGQKVRQTRFVEQEQFTFDVDLLFFRGSSGDLLFKDRLRREATFPGLANDPITAFYRLSETIAADVRAVVAPRSVSDARVLFRG